MGIFLISVNIKEYTTNLLSIYHSILSPQILAYKPSTIRMSTSTPNNENTPLNISNFNFKSGLGQYSKILAIFNKMKHDNGIILLQETHSTSKTVKNGKMNGEGK